MRCAAEGISVYTPHSALDAAWGGMNDWIARGLLEGDNGTSTEANITILEAEKFDRNGVSEGGDGRLVAFKEVMGIEVLHSRVKKFLRLEVRK